MDRLCGEGMTGDDVTISLVKGIGGTPAASLAIRGWSECFDNGFGDGTLNMDNNQNAFLAWASTLPAGVMTWTYDESIKRVWVWQSYVVPELRGRGIYRAMWHMMVEHARNELKAASIQSATHSSNKTMRKVAEKVGRYEESVVLRFDL